MSKEGTTHDEAWLGDGITATFNGWDITLSTPRDGVEHWIVIEPDVFAALVRFADAINAKYGVEHFVAAGRRARISDAVMAAFDESVKLQSHYAAILNDFDGGKRLQFADHRAWMDRLEQLKSARIP